MSLALNNWAQVFAVEEANNFDRCPAERLCISFKLGVFEGQEAA